MPKQQDTLEKKLKDLYKYINENLTYIITGAIVLVVIGGVFYSYFKPQTTPQEAEKKQEAQQNKKEEKKQENVYVVKKGDHLWKIAEETYGSGYNAIDIAKANNLKNPNLLFTGQKLILPKDVPAREPTTGEVAKAKTAQRKLNIKEYTVKKGDYLWKIAEQVYGDGYAWVKIAKANNIQNPNLIYSGQKLTIP